MCFGISWIFFSSHTPLPVLANVALVCRGKKEVATFEQTRERRRRRRSQGLNKDLKHLKRSVSGQWSSLDFFLQASRDG